MNINLTLIGQTITFFVFVWLCMKFIWPPIMSALNERKTRIADGLAAAERGMKAKEEAEIHVQAELSKAKEHAKEIIAQAHKQAGEIVEESKGDARSEGEKILAQAKNEIEQQLNQARESLRTEVVSLAIAGAEQVLMKEVDAKAHTEALTKLAARL
jgi:F-type H+-transporting ATPase subunit b